MKVRAYLKNYLIENGLWEHEAEAIIAKTETDMNNADEALLGILNQDIEGYPTQLKAVLHLTLNAKALEYIDNNKPKHFARPMFLSEKEREEFFKSAGV